MYDYEETHYLYPDEQYEWQPANVWVTKEGHRILFEDLGDRHLENIVKMLVRKARQDIAETTAFYLSCLKPRGEMAQDAFDKEFDFWCDDGTMENEVRMSRLEVELTNDKRWEPIKQECERRKQAEAEKRRQERLESEYKAFRYNEMEKYKKTLSGAKLDEIETTVSEEVKNKSKSDIGFKTFVRLELEKQLASLAGIPSFEDWARQQKF